MKMVNLKDVLDVIDEVIKQKEEYKKYYSAMALQELKKIMRSRFGL